jgi:hypothetical protein
MPDRAAHSSTPVPVWGRPADCKYFLWARACGQELSCVRPRGAAATLAAFDPNDHALAVDLADLETRHLGDAQPRRLGRRQGDPRPEARNSFEESDHFVAAENRWQLARLARVADPFGDGVQTKRHAVKEAQRADDLIGDAQENPRGREMNLKSEDILKPQTIRGAAKISSELRNGVEVGSLGRRREIADGHVLEHAMRRGLISAIWKPPV